MAFLVTAGCGALLVPQQPAASHAPSAPAQRLRLEQAYREGASQASWRGQPLKELRWAWGLPDESLLDQGGNGRLVYRVVEPPYPVMPESERPRHGFLVLVREALIVDVVKF